MGFALWRVRTKFNQLRFCWKRRTWARGFRRWSFRELLDLHGGDSRSVALITIHGVSFVSGLGLPSSAGDGRSEGQTDEYWPVHLVGLRNLKEKLLC
jgi:hypothetical protein